MTDFTSIKRKCLASDTLFEDRDFPASNASLYIRPSLSSAVRWKRPKDIVDNPQFIVEGSLYVDLYQGSLGNCWFIAASASLAATHPELLQRVAPQEQSFEKDYAGIFQFYFWQYGQWKEVYVDDRLSVDDEGQLLYCSNTKQKNEFWCALLEKAYAKLYGNYEAIDGGRIHDALLDLTGGISEIIPLRRAITPGGLVTILHYCERMNTIMGGAIFGRRRREFRRNNGLYEQHAYSIIKIKSVMYKGKSTQLLLLRNPFGEKEWNGAWSDSAPQWTELSPRERDDQSLQKRDDGEFWISVEDFIENFDELELCHLSPEGLTAESNVSSQPGTKKQWMKSEFYGRWLKGVSAGGQLRSFTSRMFWSNPQYKLKIENSKKSSVIVSLLEVSQKLVRSEDEVSIGFVIFKLKAGSEPPDLITADNYYEHSPQLSDTSGSFWPYRERSLHFVLDPATYIIVPCTFLANQEADFYLRIFSELPVEAGPIEQPIGPTVDMETAHEELIDRLFEKNRGSDGKVDAAQLQRILSAARLEEFSQNDGYSLETCRCLLSQNDRDISGLASLDDVRQIWKNVQMWTAAFREADTNKSNTVSAFELKEMFRKIGFTLDTENLHRIVRRYGGRDGQIHEDDFLQSFSKLLAFYRVFKTKSVDGSLTLTLGEWLSSTLYI